MARMDGLTAASIKKNPSLIPLFFAVGMGALGATLYLMRLAFTNPDVAWFPKHNAEPWNDYKQKQYKFMSYHYNKDTKSPAPEY
ncbi:NADH dehydrogenase (ubiquinone) MLRQ subunit [Nomia melanderi]|uniref:NADH dehydrogenase (ubiquinone) MLRQ subunit n=1 Tax=Nomia melanderi TaxID=2448451 RepID=UPI0013041630|nr:cytochrome c oxidase subunit NDUFA4 [Nomia melanderi]